MRVQVQAAQFCMNLPPWCQETATLRDQCSVQALKGLNPSVNISSESGTSGANQVLRCGAVFSSLPGPAASVTLLPATVPILTCWVTRHRLCCQGWNSSLTMCGEVDHRSSTKDDQAATHAAKPLSTHRRSSASPPCL